MGRLRYIRLTRRQRVRVWAAVVLITVTGLLTAILLHLRPMLVKLATARCSNTVSRIVVAAVNDAVEQGWMEYGRLVSFDKDSDGRVTALRSNMAEFNRLQTAVADDVLERLGLQKDHYILLSAHREEHIDTDRNFESLFTAINALAERYDMPILYACHPRSLSLIHI